MADISMCSNGSECPLRHNCYRFLAKPDEYWQAYYAYYIAGQEKCESYWRRT